MNVNVYLIIIALENHSLYVMLKNNDLPVENLSIFDSSFDAVAAMMKSSTNIHGQWLEAQPKLIGSLDSINRKDDLNNRVVSLVYYLCLPSKNRLNNSYRWVDLLDLEQIGMSEENKNIIRYAAINI